MLGNEGVLFLYTVSLEDLYNRQRISLDMDLITIWVSLGLTARRLTPAWN